MCAPPGHGPILCHGSQCSGIARSQVESRKQGLAARHRDTMRRPSICGVAGAVWHCFLVAFRQRAPDGAPCGPLRAADWVPALAARDASWDSGKLYRQYVTGARVIGERCYNRTTERAIQLRHLRAVDSSMGFLIDLLPPGGLGPSLVHIFPPGQQAVVHGGCKSE